MFRKDNFVESENWLRLIRDRNWNLRKKHQLLTHYQTPDAIFELSASQLSAATKQSYQVSKAAGINELKCDMTWLSEANHALVTLDDVNYPRLLKHIADPPLALFIIGDESLLNTPQLAIVGSRRPTPVGKEASRLFASELVQRGIAVTSGMALGVDACAHHGALNAAGQTYAVMGAGLDVIYPARHRGLFRQIEQQGLLISEYPPGTPPNSYHFPQRNRIVSGLTQGVIIIEAAINSGTMITARLAMEQNRDVFVVPGSITNKQYAGSHQLIRQGAVLVQNIDHVLQELTLFLGQELKKPPKLIESKVTNNTQVSSGVLEFVGYEPTLIEDIILASGLTAAQVSSMLLLLEIEGQVAVTDEGRYIRLE